MDCDSIKIADIAERYLHNRLGEAEMEAFETHLLECNRCRRELELLYAAQSDLAERAHEVRAGIVPKPFFLTWKLTSAAAALVAVVVAGAIFFPLRKAEKGPTAQHVPAPGEHSPAQEQPNQVTVTAEAVRPLRSLDSEKHIDNLPLNGHNYTNFSLENKRADKTRDIAPKIGPPPSSGINANKAREMDKGGEVAESA